MLVIVIIKNAPSSSTTIVNIDAMFLSVSLLGLVGANPKAFSTMFGKHRCDPLPALCLPFPLVGEGIVQVLICSSVKAKARSRRRKKKDMVLVPMASYFNRLKDTTNGQFVDADPHLPDDTPKTPQVFNFFARGMM